MLPARIAATMNAASKRFKDVPHPLISRTETFYQYCCASASELAAGCTRCGLAHFRSQIREDSFDIAGYGFHTCRCYQHKERHNQNILNQALAAFVLMQAGNDIAETVHHKHCLLWMLSRLHRERTVLKFVSSSLTKVSLQIVADRASSRLRMQP